MEKMEDFDAGPCLLHAADINIIIEKLDRGRRILPLRNLNSK